jgi:hypothetical protein
MCPQGHGYASVPQYNEMKQSEMKYNNVILFGFEK